MIDIDEAFGEGSAEKHPELVGKYMETACRDYVASSTSKALQHAFNSVAGGLEVIGSVLSSKD